MRISSSTLFDSNVAAMGQQQNRLMQTQQQVATGRRILTPATDPVAAAQALDISHSDAMNTQYASNRNSANHVLSLAESNLQSVTTLLQDVKTAVVAAGNGSLTNSDRQTFATELSGRLQELVGLANSTDGAGNYLFAGFQSKTQPFVNTATGVNYVGDDGQRMMQVSASRQMSSSDSGADIFMRIKNGNGTFVTQAAATNTGGGIVSQGNLANPPPTAAQAGNSYTLTFSVVGGVTTYSITGTDATGAPLPTAGQPAALPAAVPYVSGQNISFNGIQFDIQGAPANLDSFTVTPSVNESVFTTISDLITALKTPVTNAAPGSAALLTGSLNRGLNNLDSALNKVLTTRSTLGLRLNELGALQTAGEDLGLQFNQALSQLQGVDYNKALSDLTQQDMYLKAAQQSFVKVAGLSLFNYL